MLTPRWYGKNNAIQPQRSASQNANNFEVHLVEGASSTAEGTLVQVRVGESLAAVERKLILATLAEYEGNKIRAAQVLGVSLKTIYNKLHELKTHDERPAHQ